MGGFIAKDIPKGSDGFHKVKIAGAGAHSILTSTACLRAGIINASQTGQSVNLRGRVHPDDLGLFSSVVGITQKVSRRSGFCWFESDVEEDTDCRFE